MGSWSDPAAIAKASALSASIWSDYCSGVFDKTLRKYQTSAERQDKGLLEALHLLSHAKRQGRTIHAYRTLLKYGKTLRHRKDVDDFIHWMQQQGLKNRTIIGIFTEFRRVLSNCGNLFVCSLKVQSTTRLSDVLSASEIQAVLQDLLTNDAWFYPLFFIWLSTGLRNGELRALSWDCIRWQEQELLIHKSLRIDGLSSRTFIPASNKTGKERVVRLNPQTLEELNTHQQQMKELGLYHPTGLVFLTR